MYDAELVRLLLVIVGAMIVMSGSQPVPAERPEQLCACGVGPTLALYRIQLAGCSYRIPGRMSMRRRSIALQIMFRWEGGKRKPRGRQRGRVDSAATVGASRISSLPRWVSFCRASSPTITAAA